MIKPERDCYNCGKIDTEPQPELTLIDRSAGYNEGEAYDFCSLECLREYVNKLLSDTSAMPTIRCACLCRKCGGGVAHCGRHHRACYEPGTSKDVRVQT